ncbi:hypothetical protein [Flavobacterium limnophilum]|nr:hypothetical protein [Flavobacterium limnophilum]
MEIIQMFRNIGKEYKNKKPASHETGFVKNRILMIMLRMEV